MTNSKSELESFIDSLNDAQKATDLIRCCSCDSAVLETGKYKIKKYEGKEGVLCDDCNKEKRDIAKTIKIVDPDTKTVSYVSIEYNTPTEEEAEAEAAPKAEVQPMKENIVSKPSPSKSFGK